MKKKIIAFLMAFNIFAYTTVCCYTQTVYALPVVSADVLFNGLITLLFSFGVTLDLTGLTHQQANELIDDKIRDGLSARDNSAELLAQYEKLLDNIQNGFLLIGVELGSALCDIFYDDVIRESISVSGVPDVFKPYVGTTSGYYLYVNNYFWGANTNSPCQMLICFKGLQGTVSYINPPSLVYTGSSYYEYTFLRTAPYIATNTNTKQNCWILQNGNMTVLNNVSEAGTEYDAFAPAESRPYCDFKLRMWSKTFNYSAVGYFDSAIDTTFQGLTDVNEQGYDTIINGQWVDTDGNLTTVDGTYPQVLDGDVIGGLTDDIQDGTKTWQEALGSMVDSYPENPAYPDVSLDLSTLDNLVDSLDLERLETKFPFCIPNDLMLIINGATAVSCNSAPVIEIPLKVEFNGTVYYDNDKAVVIDFNDFSNVVAIFREGFFLLFLIALLWVSIDILQAFFVVTE